MDLDRTDLPTITVSGSSEHRRTIRLGGVIRSKDDLDWTLKALRIAGRLNKADQMLQPDAPSQ